MGKNIEKVLVHACCGPCAIYPLEQLAQQGLDIMIYAYNPNIHPYQEYQKRLENLKRLADLKDIGIIVKDEYDPEAWIREVAFREKQRCRICYGKRIEQAARTAKRSKFDAFTTTLLYSIKQNHDLIRQLGEAMAQQFGITFLYQDFRQGWERGIKESKRLKLYRQQYCGCLLSERDRFQKNFSRHGQEPGDKT